MLRMRLELFSDTGRERIVEESVLLAISAKAIPLQCNLLSDWSAVNFLFGSVHLPKTEQTEPNRTERIICEIRTIYVKINE